MGDLFIKFIFGGSELSFLFKNTLLAFGDFIILLRKLLLELPASGLDQGRSKGLSQSNLGLAIGAGDSSFGHVFPGRAEGVDRGQTHRSAWVQSVPKIIGQTAIQNCLEWPYHLIGFKEFRYTEQREESQIFKSPIGAKK